MLKLRKLMTQRGFTLVELLIVIAVIGILAIAVLAALDPVEQLKKARDTGRLSDAREMYNAMTRYYSSYNCYPDELDAATNQCTSATFAIDNYKEADASNPNHEDTMKDLITKGELKPAFESKQSVTRGQLWYGHTDTGEAAVCFHPESKSARAGGMGAVLDSSGTDAAIFSQTAGTCDTTQPFISDPAENEFHSDAVDCAVCVQ